MENDTQEKLHGNAEKEHKKDYEIIVNGRQKVVTTKELTFAQVVALADNLPTGENIVYTVTYRKAEGKKQEGTLVEGESVKVKDGTIFNVTATDKS
ncbi:MAG: multiubiquitin domain-containing protein [bacterium]|nr:multiubiquitin domain-containing protein [bacterium]